MMSDDIMKVSLDEITAEKIEEIENYIDDSRLVSMVREKLVELGDHRNLLRTHLAIVEAQCKVRAIRAMSLGISPKELSEIFGISVATLKKWHKEQ